MSTNLIRTQLLLDKQVVAKTRKKIKLSKTSLAAYIRDLMIQNLDENKKNQEKKSSLLSFAGKFKGQGDPNAAINHNDIYKI